MQLVVSSSNVSSLLVEGYSKLLKIIPMSYFDLKNTSSQLAEMDSQ